MVTAVDTRGTEEYRDFIYRTFKKITAKYPEHSFIFLSEKPVDPTFINSQNIIPVIVTTPALAFLREYKLSPVLHKYNIDVLVTQRSMQTKVPQCLIVFDKTRVGSLKKAAVIITDSQASAKQIQDTFKIGPGKFNIVYKAADEAYVPISTDQKEIIKESLTEGNEFFLAGVSSTANLVNVLKAFSVFKKMQKSNMHLLIISSDSDESLSLLDSYKFKSEVKVLEDTDPQQMPVITASAYAFISVSDYSHIFEAMQCGIPVIADDAEINVEICGEAALYFNANDHAAIADKLMMVYKDENLRAALIKKGSELVHKFNWDNSAVSLWKSIEKACG